jgi:hypothetical protein
MRKINLLVCLIFLFLFACAAPQQDISATTVPSPIVTVAILTPVVPEQTSTPGLIPKHNDLVFVEFFAVT